MFTGLAFGQENIVNRGLILYLDAADKTSYPNTGNNWNDLAGNGYGTINNGAFDPVDGRGNIGFDGTNDDVVLSNVTNFNTSVFQITGGTLSVWFKIDQADHGTRPSKLGGPLWGSFNGNTGRPILNIVRSLKVSGGGTNYEAITISDNDNGGINTGLFAYEATTSPEDERKYADANWHNVVLTVGAQGSSIGTKVYMDGSEVSLTYDVGSSSNNGWFIRGTNGSPNIVYLGKNNPQQNSRLMQFAGDIGVYMIYNRPLTENEVLQNYNTLKGRYTS